MDCILEWIKQAFSLLSKVFKSKGVSGNQNITGNITAGRDVKLVQNFSLSKNNEETKRLIKEAYGELDYNGPYVGDGKVLFKYHAIEELLAHSLLSHEHETLFRNYISDIGICNGGRGGRGVTPGKVQGQSKVLKKVLNEYMEFY